MKFERIVSGKHASGRLRNGTQIFVSVLPESVSVYTIRWLFLYRKIWKFSFSFYIRTVGASWESAKTILGMICELIEKVETIEELQKVLDSRVNDSLDSYVNDYGKKALETSIAKVGEIHPWKLLSKRIKAAKQNEKIIHDFGAVLERVSQDPQYPTTKYPASLLPHPRVDIRKALHEAIEQETDYKMRNALEVTLITLDDFVTEKLHK